MPGSCDNIGGRLRSSKLESLETWIGIRLWDGMDLVGCIVWVARIDEVHPSISRLCLEISNSLRSSKSCLEKVRWVVTGICVCRV